MSLFGDYMEGVPVKISERFKRPPRIELGRGALECEAGARRALDVADYGFAFEGRVLAKLNELRAAKETLRSERRHRLRLLDEAKQRRIDDLAAAEAAERLGQLSMAQVSYPSTDDVGEAPAAVAPLLQPVRLSAHSPPLARDLLAEPDPLRELQRVAPRAADLRRLTFSDFEHDTSSPFDDLELQSIDDLEQLAQVLREPDAAPHSDPAPRCPDPSHYYRYPTVATVDHRPVHSRSRSVPDIVRELGEEVASERLRAERHSTAASPAPAPAPAPAHAPAPASPDPYDELPPRLQEMCRSIEGMGFPLERVVRVCTLLGDSDKKVIEGLLLVGQLLDLGFPESRVSAALAKHHFNRDKALDELIA